VALRRFLSGVRASPRGLAAVEPDDADPDNADPSPVPAAEVPDETRAALAASVATLVADTYVDADLRRDALAVARLLGGGNYAGLLADLADQSELEGTQLLSAVQAERRRVRAPDPRP
jgi:hypothetical protein